MELFWKLGQAGEEAELVGEGLNRAGGEAGSAQRCQEPSQAPTQVLLARAGLVGEDSE